MSGPVQSVSRGYSRIPAIACVQGRVRSAIQTLQAAHLIPQQAVLGKGSALDIPAGYGRQESADRSQQARRAIESNGLANTTRIKFSLRDL
jgi:hypothetical protein